MGYQHAADIRSWRLVSEWTELGTLGTTVSAIVSGADDFWATQSPLTLSLQMGSAWWTWRQAEVQYPILVGYPIEMVVKGNPEVSDG